MEQLQYVKAAKNYEKAVSKKPNNIAQKKLANTYRLMNDTKKGVDAYAKVVNQSNAEPIDRFYYAQMLMANRKHSDAANVLREYLKSNPGDKMAESMLKSCESPEVFMKDTAKYTVTKAKIGNVTEFYGPVQYKDGLVISASIDGKGKDKVPQTGKSYYKLYFTKKDKNGSYSTPEKLSGNINKNELHTASATYSKDGSVVYYTASNTDGLSKTELLENLIGLKINKDTIANGTYLKGSEFPYNSKSYSVGHPALTPDSKTMYFISDMPGGSGGTDIYETKWEGGKWAQPTNLGDKINSIGNEMYPYVDSLGNLYFSSNGHKGLGGLDIFKATKNGNAWTKVENMNYPINSSNDDFGFMIYADNKTGFLSSNRDGAADKIYEFILQASKVNIGGKVLSKVDGKPIAGAKIEITDKARNTTDTVFTAEDGSYSYQLAPNTDFDITVSKEGFFSQSEDVSTVNQVDGMLKDFTLEELVKDKPVVIDEADDKGVRPIFYDFDKSEIRPDAFEPLNKLAKRLKDNPKITIELSSHTDSRGTDTYNQDLSFKRAKSAKKYLESKGVKPNRIKVKGYGETKPVNKCVDGVPCTDDEYQANRRTEFKVIEINK